MVSLTAICSSGGGCIGHACNGSACGGGRNRSDGHFLQWQRQGTVLLATMVVMRTTGTAAMKTTAGSSNDDGRVCIVSITQQISARCQLHMLSTSRTAISSLVWGDWQGPFWWISLSSGGSDRYNVGTYKQHAAVILSSKALCTVLQCYFVSKMSRLSTCPDPLILQNVATH